MTATSAFFTALTLVIDLNDFAVYMLNNSSTLTSYVFQLSISRVERKKSYMWNISEYEESSYARITKMNKLIKQMFYDKKHGRLWCIG